MNMDFHYESNPLDFQFFDRFGLDLDFMNSPYPDLDWSWI